MTDTNTLLDFETRLGGDDHAAIRLWLRLLTCTTLVETEIRTRLREQFHTTLARFDLLAQLERAPRGLRMSELSGRLMVTRGNVTGLARQLEHEGLVERENHPHDRRTVTLHLTPKGRERFSEMATAHEHWIAQLFGDLTTAERDQLHHLLGTLKSALTRKEHHP